MSFDIIKGMATTLKNIGKKPTTISYPEEERPLPPRFRGRHVLHRYENGLERCVGCYLCAGACPADAIYIEAEENSDDNHISPGERYARIYDVNLLRCIFCGYCEQACPTGAITLENIYELASTHPEDLVYHKEQLLEPVGSATRGSLEAWAAPAPAETTTPLPGRQGFFDGLPATAASVGQADLPTETEILVPGSETINTSNPSDRADARTVEAAEAGDLRDAGDAGDADDAGEMVDGQEER